ncbi:hypothetical protein HPB47_012448 [Ixodes persulcatus]|uniref:Uncharacterized protein n=1 Tax=Ixodes persulcatus TaxID=34615 RepID=A0AC60NTL9_IXOPE|nr:hypothetical protein HPB47_012448 [Ixodes persulcatus]
MVLVPLYIAFFPGRASTRWIIFLAITEVLLISDIFLNFRTGVVEDLTRNVVIDHGEIAKRYLRGWFLVDVISSAPLDIVVWLIPVITGAQPDPDPAMARVVRLLSFVKLLKLSRLVRYGSRTEQILFFHSSGTYLQLANILGMIFLAIHWHACLQFFVGLMMRFPPESWISIAALQKKPWTEQYSWAVFNTVSLMMTTGYGLGKNTKLLVEEWIQVLGMFAGAIWQALLLGYGSNLLDYKDLANRRRRERVLEVEEYMSYYGVPEELRERIRSYYSCEFQKKSYREAAILSSLSGPLKEVCETRSNTWPVA